MAWPATVLAVLSLLTAALSLPSTPAVAAEDPPVRVMVVLDVSGSMGRVDGSGQTLLRGAKNALGELVGSLPAKTVLGVRAYGSEYAGRDKSVSCRDTRLLVPPRTVDPARVASAVRPLRSTGDTPIGLALRRAYADLGTSPASRRIVVLISDGEDNCSPADTPPCEVAQQLRADGVKVQVQTIGFALGGAGRARSQLQCISRSTQGDYYDARNGDALSAAVERISSQQLGGLGTGTPVAGSRSLRAARLLEPGTYRVQLLPGESAWFRFRAPRDSRPRVLATVKGLTSLPVPLEDRRCPAWRVELYNPYGEGGTYPPYGNSARFDGVGYGVTGASSSGLLSPTSLGIDYSGRWAVQLSLARDTLETCSQHLPVARPFTARFSIATGARADSAPKPSDGKAATQQQPSATPGTTPGTTSGSTDPQSTEAGEESAGEKYRTPVSDSAPGWVYPMTAVGLLVGAGALVIAVLALRRRRARGW